MIVLRQDFLFICDFIGIHPMVDLPQWPHGLKRVFTIVRLLELRVRIPPEIWNSVSCVCCVLWSSGLCFGMITSHFQRSRTMCGVTEGDREAFIKRRPWPNGGS
jgi:hypothetical protein